jgi:hypothetical protein
MGHETRLKKMTMKKMNWTIMTEREDMALERRIIEDNMTDSLWTEKRLKNMGQTYSVTAFVVRGKRSGCSTRILING